MLIIILLFSAFEISPLPKYLHPLSRESGFNIFLNPAVFSEDGIRGACIFSRLYSMPDLDIYSAGGSWTSRPYYISAQISQFGNPLYREITAGLAGGYKIGGQSAVFELKPMFLSIKGYGSKVIWSSDFFAWTEIDQKSGFGIFLRNVFSTTYGTSQNSPPFSTGAHYIFEYFDDVSIAISASKVKDKPIRKSFSLSYSLSALSLNISYADNPGEFSAGFEISTSGIFSHYGLSSHSELGYTHTACVFWEKNFQPRQKPRGQNTAFLPPDTVSFSLFPADINRVSAELLDRIPGIGPVLAKRIIDYRDEKGGIDNLEELLNVNGIGENLFEKIKPYLTTGE